jgi:hypothetical protein
VEKLKIKFLDFKLFFTGQVVKLLAIWKNIFQEFSNVPDF